MAMTLDQREWESHHEADVAAARPSAASKVPHLAMMGHIHGVNVYLAICTVALQNVAACVSALIVLEIGITNYYALCLLSGNALVLCLPSSACACTRCSTKQPPSTSMSLPRAFGRSTMP